MISAPADLAPPDLFRAQPSAAVEQLHAATAVYTRDHIVDELLDLAGWPACGGSLLDPGAGDAVFAERALARLAFGANDVAAVAERIQAWEIHPYAADAARGRVARHLARRGWRAESAWAAASRVVVEADFLAPGPGRSDFTVVAGNPPYLRFAALPDEFKARYTRFVPSYARNGLLPAFLNRCLDVVHAEGRIACITADRWLFNETQAALREHMGSRLGLAACVRLDARSAFHCRKHRRRGTPPRVHAVAVLLTAAARETAPLSRSPIHPGATQPLPGARRLGDVATVRLAPWLGPAGVFVLASEDAADFPSELLVPCVDTADIRGDDLGEPTRVALRTTRTEPPAAVCRHLQQAIARLPHRARRNPFWMPPESWGPLPLAEDALLVPRIARTLRAVRLPRGVLPINHNLTVVIPGGDRNALARAMTAPEARRWIEERAPRLENGFLSITTRMLRNLPIRLD